MRATMLLMILSSVLAAQAPDRTLIETASRTVTLVADEATFAVSATALPDLPQAQVAAALARAGVREEHLIAVETPGQPGLIIRPPGPGLPTAQMITYQFQMTVAGERLKGTLDALEGIRRNLPRGVVNVAFGMAATASDRQVEEARQRVTPLLIEDARRKAEALARAAGVRLGAVRAVNEGAGTIIPTGVIRAAAFGLPISVPSNLRPTFVVTVQFAFE